MSYRQPVHGKDNVFFLDQLSFEINAFGLFDPALQRLANLWADTQPSDHFPRRSWREG